MKKNIVTLCIIGVVCGFIACNNGTTNTPQRKEHKILVGVNPDIFIPVWQELGVSDTKMAVVFPIINQAVGSFHPDEIQKFVDKITAFHVWPDDGEDNDSFDNDSDPDDKPFGEGGDKEIDDNGDDDKDDGKCGTHDDHELRLIGTTLNFGCDEKTWHIQALILDFVDDIY